MQATIPYLNITEAQTYFDERLNTNAWDEASSTDQLKALKEATRRINNLNFVGSKTDSTQINEFPRNGDIDIIDDIKAATCELALQLLDGVDPNLEIENIGTSSQTFAMNKNSYDRSFTMAHIRAGIPSAEAWSYLIPYLKNPLVVTLKRIR